MAVVDVSLFTGIFLLFTLAYVIALVYVALLERVRSRNEGVAQDHAFSLLVPARNEAAVIAFCLERLLALDYPSDRFEIVVVDDGSDDATGKIVAEAAAAHPGRVHVVRIPPTESGRGKASALNMGYQFLRATSRFRERPDWIVGVFDADGSPDADMLSKASFQFRSPRVGGIQATVRIRNRDVSWLTRMQDIEFAGFARMTQLIRTRITRSASLGGNGQFVRAAALEECALERPNGTYWNPEALTEDLELASRLALRNWDMQQLNTAKVWQEGVENLGALMTQRTRWAWGSLQVFLEYVVRLRVFTTPGVRLRKRLDLLFNLSMFLISPLVMITWIISAISFLGLISVASGFPAPVMILLSIGYFPVVGYGLLTVEGYRRRTLPADLLGFALYTYHWVPCLYLGLWHVMARHVPVWWKTTRFARHPAG
ncbi:MAG TPA: glycosyltransferase family 2 protein [Thermoplasmata archaeon]|jgi:cellulose synthase/poly-beta-1,6-N-acetylglucosamine synthase-like glycosyltransferase